LATFAATVRPQSFTRMLEHSPSAYPQIDDVLYEHFIIRGPLTH